MAMTQPVVEFTYEDYGGVSAEPGGLWIVPAPNPEHRKVCFKGQGELDLDRHIVEWRSPGRAWKLNSPALPTGLSP